MMSSWCPFTETYECCEFDTFCHGSRPCWVVVFASLSSIRVPFSSVIHRPRRSSGSSLRVLPPSFTLICTSNLRYITRSSHVERRLLLGVGTYGAEKHGEEKSPKACERTQMKAAGGKLERLQRETPATLTRVASVSAAITSSSGHATERLGLK